MLLVSYQNCVQSLARSVSIEIDYIETCWAGSTVSAIGINLAIHRWSTYAGVIVYKCRQVHKMIIISDLLPDIVTQRHRPTSAIYYCTTVLYKQPHVILTANQYWYPFPYCWKFYCSDTCIPMLVKKVSSYHI